MPIIQVIIQKDGNVQVEGFDFVGPVCEGFIEKVTEALGTVQTAEDKPEKFLNSTQGLCAGC